MIEEYLNDPFGYLDSLDLTIRGYNVNLLKNHVKLRGAILQGVAITGLLWLVMGFDSGTGMLEFPIIKALQGDFRFSYWYHWAYGKTMHWSAFVIYGLMFFFISRYLDTLDIRKSANSILSFGFVFFNIAAFEYFWIYGFAFFHKQAWVAKWAWPQVRILIQNLALILCGALSLVVMRDVGFRLKSRGFWVSLLVTLAITGFWVYYPYPVTPLEVEVEGLGSWQPSSMFPQTLYTIDLDITDNVNAGEWFYVKDPLVHFTNTLVKVMFALTGILYVRGLNYEA